MIALGCTPAEAPPPTTTSPPVAAIECPEPPPKLVRELDRPLTITPCALPLEPPALDLEQRVRTIETIHALGPEDPHSLLLASEVASSELAAANWEGLDDPGVQARLRSTITLLEPLVDSPAQASSSVLDMGLVALMCAHAALGEAKPAQAYAQAVLSGHSGMWGPVIYLTVAELSSDQDARIRLYERAAHFDGYQAYAKYQLAWTLRHPTIIDQERAVQLLEEVGETETWPRLQRLLRHRAALELRALGREVEVPALSCE